MPVTRTSAKAPFLLTSKFATHDEVLGMIPRGRVFTEDSLNSYLAEDPKNMEKVIRFVEKTYIKRGDGIWIMGRSKKLALLDTEYDIGVNLIVRPWGRFPGYDPMSVKPPLKGPVAIYPEEESTKSLLRD